MKTIWYRIVQWCQENLSRARYEVIAEAITSPPFDWSYLLRLERAKLCEMKKYFELTNGTFDHTNDIKWISAKEIGQYDFCPADTEILLKLDEVYGE